MVMRAKLISSVMATALAGLSAQAASALETRSYVVSHIMPAGYAYDGDCEVMDPVSDGKNTPLRSFVRRKLAESGKTPEEIDKMLESGAGVLNAIMHRGKVNGKSVNVFGNPEAVPDPQMHLVTGKYAYGFDLDGKGPLQPTAFE